MFVDLSITNVQRLFLRDCEVSEVEPRAFRRLTNLVELDLSGNRLREVPTEAWKMSESLMRLKLSDNPVKLIRNGAFRRLGQLIHLGLSDCRIETIEDGAFDGLESLRELKLDGNRLNYLHGQRLFPTGLTLVEVIYRNSLRSLSQTLHLLRTFKLCIQYILFLNDLLGLLTDEYCFQMLVRLIKFLFICRPLKLQGRARKSL